MKVDVIVDLSYGDCGKGKVTYDLLRKKNYTHCVRYNGGHNAGHTIFHEGKEVITHIIPAGVFFGVKSIIGPGCVVNMKKFLDELKSLKRAGVKNVHSLVKICNNTHIITEGHLEEDGEEKKIGTTKQGTGPAYRDKYARIGHRAKTIFGAHDFCIDFYREMFYNKKEPIVLMEGAQGFGLDIDWGDYPYVTSSHCTVGGAILNGIPPQSIRDVYGICKPYETYSGNKDFQPRDDFFNVLREIGKEYGNTTGRARQCNYLDVHSLKKAVRLNGVSHLIVNKMDILREAGRWVLRDSRKHTTHQFPTEEQFKECLKDTFRDIEVVFSYSPEEV